MRTTRAAVPRDAAAPPGHTRPVPTRVLPTTQTARMARPTSLETPGSQVKPHGV